MTLSPAYQDLLDIDDVQPFTPETDQIIFDEIKALLQKHNALQRFGVTLLHTHYPIMADEELVETCDLQTRTLTLRPHRGGYSPGISTIETAWRLDRPMAAAYCQLKCRKSGGGKHHESHSRTE